MQDKQGRRRERLRYAGAGKRRAARGKLADGHRLQEQWEKEDIEGITDIKW